MAPARTRGPYAKSAAVRQRIVAACANAFGDTGFHGATMKDIAQRAGISHTSTPSTSPRRSTPSTARRA